MKIEFTGRGTEVPTEVRRLAQRKLDKLDRVLPGVPRAHVIVTQDKHRHVVEVTVRSPRLELTAQDEGNELGVSLAAVIARLARQARRRRQKRRTRRRRAQPRVRAGWGRGEPAAARMTALYRRKDGKLGLSEPEA